jgi:hypothetical protein
VDYSKRKVGLVADIYCCGIIDVGLLGMFYVLRDACRIPRTLKKKELVRFAIFIVDAINIGHGN